MRDLQQILSDASLLSQQDLRQLIYALEELTETPGAESIPSAPYTRSLAAAGSVAGAFSDVSADKYKHLAEAYTSTDNHP
jgi:hypothetical protein